jgi:uncharacterized protein with NRDE domain
MCTVTFVNAGNKIFLTSNRDEKYRRKPAVAPEAYSFPNGKIIYPKDADAGGTWFAAHENGNVIVLLNGAFVKHKPAPPYRHSRGLVILKLLQRYDVIEQFNKIDLENIEPFTLVIWYEGKLYESRWDGENKFLTEKDNMESHIWSSATLYDNDIVSKREEWFAEWLRENKLPIQDDIFHFHQFTGDGDRHNDLLMNRDGEVATVSITGVELSKDNALVKYLDLLQHKVYNEHIPLLKTITVNS